MKGRRLLAAIVVEPRHPVIYLRVACLLHGLQEGLFQLSREGRAIGEVPSLVRLDHFLLRGIERFVDADLMRVCLLPLRASVLERLSTLSPEFRPPGLGGFGNGSPASSAHLPLGIGLLAHLELRPSCPLSRRNPSATGSTDGIAAGLE